MPAGALHGSRSPSVETRSGATPQERLPRHSSISSRLPVEHPEIRALEDAAERRYLFSCCSRRNCARVRRFISHAESRQRLTLVGYFAARKFLAYCPTATSRDSQL